jgi:hypothetical protein
MFRNCRQRASENRLKRIGADNGWDMGAVMCDGADGSLEIRNEKNEKKKFRIECVQY